MEPKARKHEGAKQMARKCGSDREAGTAPLFFSFFFFLFHFFLVYRLSDRSAMIVGIKEAGEQRRRV